MAWPWDNSNEFAITSPATDPEGLHAGQMVARGAALFWETGDLHRRGVNSWNPTDGARPFIRWMNDFTKGAFNLGTDGTDLVWTYGEGKDANDTDYPIKSIMTAPFTTDPAALEPRRLRSQSTISSWAM